MKTLHPESRKIVFWNGLLILSILYNCVVIPFQFFTKFVLIPTSIAFLFDLVSDLIFILDIYLRFNTGYVVRGQFIDDRRQIRQRYLQSWFWRHLLSSVPIDFLIRLFFPSQQALMLLLRLPRLLRLPDGFFIFKTWEHDVDFNPLLVRMTRLFTIIFIVEHWTACLWLGIEQSTDIEVRKEMFEQYLLSLYWSVTTLTTVGYGDISALEDGRPTSILKLGFTIVVMMLGVSMYAYVIGNVASLISNLNASLSRFREKLDRVQTYMRERDIPRSIQRRVMDYYQYMWEYNKGTSTGGDDLVDLPEGLQAQIALHLHRGLVESVPIFQDASPAFIEQIIVRLKPEVYPPSHYVIREGEIGNEMYFVKSGQLEAFSEETGQVYSVMKDGAFFGEIALLNEVRRTASVKTMTYCELFVLEREDFEQEMEDYPDFARHVQSVAESRQS